ncbi:ribonuclease R [Burkholderia pseudomallei Pakistan 9]|nr:ribonuclease R [Burkholderia pseudomallei Pakistan 9]
MCAAKTAIIDGQTNLSTFFRGPSASRRARRNTRRAARSPQRRVLEWGGMSGAPVRLRLPRSRKPNATRKIIDKPLSKYPYPIPSREEILGVLRTSDAPLAANDIAEALSIKRQEREGFFRRVAAMERDGQIRLDKRGHYQLTHPSNFVAGRVQGHRDGYGFVIRDDGQDDLFLPNAEMQKVMHNDRVLARIVGYDRRGRPEGHVVEVTERANKRVIGRLLNENGALIVAPEDKRISHDILVTQNAKKAKVGQVVVVELTDFPSRHSQPLGRVCEVLGDIDDPGMEIEIAVRKYGVPHEFGAQALGEAAALPDKVRPADLRYRVDLRDVPLVTIDGEDARDFDDAVYCEPAAVGRGEGFRLIVAIADVSHYVQPGSPLDADAVERSTSVYFPRRVIPMLPEKLSNGLCSLNPQVDRCVLACDMIINARGDIKAYQFYPAVIHSAARLTYTEVAAVLSNTKGPEAARRAELMPHLQHLYGVYKALFVARQKRGAIDFDTTETYIVCNAQGKIEQILPRQRNDAHRLIEECMLAANVCAADFLKRNKHPGLYRVHAGPTPEKLENLRAFLRDMGLTLGGGDTPHASDYAALMAHIRDRPDAQMLQPMLLRSMQQAVYSPDNIGHFGLAYDAYAHFTSPIRRYPDLLTHRAIYAILSGKKYTPKSPEGVELNTALSPRARAMQREDDEARGRARSNAAIWEELGLHCSSNERRADEASRDVEAWLKCYFMRDKLGEEYGGMVNGVTSFGIFVQLDALFIEGLVHVTELGADYFQYDEVKNELRGERTGIRYRLSDRVRVQVSRVDLDARKIDFRLVRETPVKAPRPASAVAAEAGAGGPRVRALPPAEGAARRKKAASAPSAAVKEARAARKKGAASKPAAKKVRSRKKY